MAKADGYSLVRLLESRRRAGRLLVADRDGSVVGAVGLELLGKRALLRSLVVGTGSRNIGIGKSLASEAIRRARATSIDELFLLTIDAAPFFERLGFEHVPHADAPPEVVLDEVMKG